MTRLEFFRHNSDLSSSNCSTRNFATRSRLDRTPDNFGVTTTVRRSRVGDAINHPSGVDAAEAVDGRADELRKDTVFDCDSVPGDGGTQSAFLRASQAAPMAGSAATTRATCFTESALFSCRGRATIMGIGSQSRSSASLQHGPFAASCIRCLSSACAWAVITLTLRSSNSVFAERPSSDPMRQPHGARAPALSGQVAQRGSATSKTKVTGGRSMRPTAAPLRKAYPDVTKLRRTVPSTDLST